MNYNQMMISQLPNITISQNILPGVGDFPLSQSLLIHTNEMLQAEQKINGIAEPLFHSPPAKPDDINIRITALDLEKLKLFGIYYGAAVSIQSNPLDSYHILLPLQGKLSVESGSTEVIITPGEAIIYPPGSYIKNSWSPACVMFVVIISRQEMQQTLYHRMSTVTSLPQFVVKVNVKSGKGKSFTNLLSCLCAEYDNHDDDPHISISNGLQELLLISLLQLFSPSKEAGTRLKGTHKRRQGVGRAIDFLQKNTGRAVSSSELSQEAFLSQRSLQLGFNESFNIGPMTYSKHLRLARARDFLIQKKRLSVTEVARQFGFDNPGTFTRLYKKRYGEFPSTTLRKDLLGTRTVNNRVSEISPVDPSLQDVSKNKGY